MRNRIITELYLGPGLGWVDVSVDGRQGVADSGGGTTITRTDRDSGTMSMVLANPGGRYSPRNPRSPYYGLLGRNTPVRVGLLELVDAFDRTVAAGWGTGWTSFGAGAPLAASDSDVVAGAARHRVPVLAGYRVSYYSARRWRDCEVRVTCDMVATNITGGPVEPANMVLRMQDINTYYMARVEVSASEVVTVSLHHSTGGAIAAAVTVPGLVFAGQPLRVAASCVGDRLAIKCWDPAAGGEPRDWQLTAVDRRLTAAGWVGIRSGVAGSNTNTLPVEFRYDDLAVLDRRACMEVTSWPPRWNLAGTDTWVPVPAAGILRRLSQGAKPLDSALYRYLPTTGPSAYWPLEDPPGSLSARSAVAGVGPMRPFGYSRFTAPGTGEPVEAAGLPVFGSGDGIPGSAPVIDLAQGGVLSGTVPASGAGTWRIEWVMVAPRDQGAAVIPIQWTTAAGTWNTWTIQIDPTGLFGTFGSPTTAAGSVTKAFGIWDGLPHHYAVEVGPVGGVLIADLRIDGAWVANFNPFTPGAMVGATAGSITGVTINPLEIRQSETVGQAMPILGHITVRQPYPATEPATFAAMGGYAGETAADRIVRLCAEQGVPVFVSRGPDPSAAMGPQRVATFLDLIRECVDADGGLLGEAREQLALTYRCLGALYNQPAVAALDYTLLTALDPDEPADDVRNDITVKRPDGDRARAVLEVGPLSTQPPPAGVGVYDTAPTVNIATDAQLPDQAGWRLHLGTWDEARYPRAKVDLGAPEWAANVDLAAAVTALDAGGVATIDGLPAWLPPGRATQQVRGSVEQLDEHTRTLAWTLVPDGPYTVAAADGEPPVPADGSTLAAPLSAAGLTFQLASTAVNGPWSTAAGDFPLDVRVGGERIRLSGITGTSSPQTATVATGGRGINGVVVAWPTGTPVDVWIPAIIPL
ncbi:hypothetical protein ACH4T9_19985 [Micromonospora sp. NPDC020750]|uniref:hypothetical protein n=1 Tax=unclassified Micromonospora TaxID=2617518 RepID=UPI0037B4A835